MYVELAKAKYCTLLIDKQAQEHQIYPLNIKLGSLKIANKIKLDPLHLLDDPDRTLKSCFQATSKVKLC